MGIKAPLVGAEGVQDVAYISESRTSGPAEIEEAKSLQQVYLGLSQNGTGSLL